MTLPGIHRQGGAAPRAEGVRPGALSTLLEELVRAPGDAPAGSGWEQALRPGAVIGRFELVREVGRGGFGVVYEARDRELGRTVAFKAVQLGDRADVQEDRLRREAEAAARLSHPNIVTLHDVGRSEHGPYLVLELLRGRTLAERLEQGPMALREAVRVAVEVAKGLAHAHEQGVIHRDLTPGNVFLCDDGQVKILDFGMAHAFGRRKLEGGTPSSMAPEQWRGAPEDERTDVFAFGVMLYRMLSGQAPFPGGARPARTSRPAPALDVSEQPALGKLVAAMLERDPVQRPRDAGEVLSALTAFQQELARAPSGGGPLATVRRGRRPAWRVALLVAIGVAIGALVAALVARDRSERRGVGGPPSIAVLPFADMSPQKDQEYFSDGLSEEILNALAHVDGLKVAGRTSSFAFKGRSEDLRSIGQKLNVGAVLEGSVRKAGNRVRITAQVIDLSDGYHLWSETFDRELTDIFAVQDEIARAVADALKVKLLPRQARVAERRTANPEAYNHFLLARRYYSQFAPDNMRRSAEEYRKAVTIDPGLAPAWAGLAITIFNSMDEKDHGGAPPGAPATGGRDEAMLAAERAVALDPELAEGYSARGILRGAFRRDWAGAQADMERALRLSPGDATILRRYAILRSMLGRAAEAIPYARQAAEADPLFPSNWVALAEAYLVTRQYGAARTAIQRALEVAPEYEGLRTMLAGVSLLEGKPAEALAEVRGVGDEPERLTLEALAEHSLGHAREAQQALDTLVAKYGEKKAPMVAVVYAWRGERDKAFEWIDRASARDDKILFELQQNPILISLRDDPRYRALLKRMSFPVE